MDGPEALAGGLVLAFVLDLALGVKVGLGLGFDIVACLYISSQGKKRL